MAADHPELHNHTLPRGTYLDSDSATTRQLALDNFLVAGHVERIPL
jgi:hypothetical protein